MKKNIRLIIICCIVAAVLAGLVTVLVFTKPAEEDKGTAEEEVTSRLMYEKNSADLKKLTIENAEDSFAVERVEIEGTSVWTVREIANLPLSSSKITTLLSNASSVTIQDTVVENPEDISIYGLDNPSATVTAEFSDEESTVKKLIIGNETPKGTTRYFMIDGDPAVYTVYSTAYSNYLKDKWDIVNKTVFSAAAPSDDEDITDYARINKMTITRPDIDYDIVIEYDVRLDDEDSMVANSSSYVMTSPVFRELNPETSSEVTENVFGLTAIDMAVANPTEEDLLACGITMEPAAVITVNAPGDNNMTLTIGKSFKDEEKGITCRFAYVEGVSIIYVFDESSLPWIDVMPLEITTTMFTSNYVYTLESVDITAGSEKLSFEVSGSSADDFAVKLDGREDDSDRFKELYQFILRAPSSEIYLEENNEPAALTIDIKTADGGDLIEFIPSDNRQAVIRLNGRTAYKCAYAYVERLIGNMELYRNGEPIITNW